MNAGNFSWHELLTDEVEGAKKFYEAMFGWSFTEQGENGDYWVFNDGDKDAGGIMKRPDGTPEQSFWTSYVTVDDLDATIARAQSLGGTIRVGPIDGKNVGRFIAIEDPQGAYIHAIEYHAEARLPDGSTPGVPGSAGEPPRPGQICWHTLMTGDISRAKSFYEAVFDWSFTESPAEAGHEAWTITNGGDPVAGVMAIQPDAQTPAWGLSITVDDVERAAANAKKHGGRVVIGPSPSGKIGKNVVIADSTGALLSLFEANMEEMMRMLQRFG